MSLYRFYTPIQFHKNEIIHFQDEEFHHLKHVMRCSEGESVELVNGKGFLAQAKINSINKRKALLEILKVEFFELEKKLVLLQGLPKINKLDLIVEKGTELGMTELILFRADKSDQKWNKEKISRLESKAISALKQSKRVHLPKIKWVSSVDSFEENLEGAFYGEVSKQAPLFFSELNNFSSLNTIHFCCGPESGFSQKEQLILKEKGFRGVSLHSNILRCESAPLSFLSLAHHYLQTLAQGPVIN